MATWAIGDLQGCFDELQALLDRIDYHRERDLIWFTGDLVNRGPNSLECLRFVHGLGERAITVLGNHDLHLLAHYHASPPRPPSADLQTVLGAPDIDDLLEWLRRQPLLHHDRALGYCLVHAGLPPQWTIDEAGDHAAHVETVLRSAAMPRLLGSMYGNEPALWSTTLDDEQRLRYTINVFTRLRYVNAEGRLALDEKGAPGSQPEGFMPWFEHPGRRSRGTRLIFGHWSTLGQLGRLVWPNEQVWGLDSGCVWGGNLSALCLETGELVSQPCPVDQSA